MDVVLKRHHPVPEHAVKNSGYRASTYRYCATPSDMQVFLAIPVASSTLRKRHQIAGERWVDQTVVRWNQITAWLGELDLLRQGGDLRTS